MSSWYEALGLTDTEGLKWPYPVRYGVENVVEADVLVLGGGPAGSMAAISAAKKGLKVVMVEKSHPKSGGGTGIDHWLFTPNPCSSVTPEECATAESESYNGYSNSMSRYIASREAYDTLLAIEEMGGKIRDTADEFKGADFRDEKTKFLFAYDYENKIMFRVWGTTFKPALYETCKKLGVNMFKRVMITSLLSEKGEVGARIVGATGLNSRTGEFYAFKAKATVQCLAFHESNWGFSSELTGLPSFHPNVVADGPAVAWRAGAEFTMMEKSCPSNPPGYLLPTYGTGNPKNTWYPCNMVDAKGKQIPWVDGKGRPITDFSQRTHPAPDQKFFGERAQALDYKQPRLIDDLPERVRQGEFELPLYADLPGMPEQERKVIWDLMIGQEGRSRVPVRENYTAAGFDPDKDLLKSYFMIGGEPYSGIQSSVLPQFRGRGPFASPGGLVTDWNLQTNLEGLFAAGSSLFAANYYHHAATTGRYAGRKAADFALKHKTYKPVINQEQAAAEKERIYAPIARSSGIDWKELRAGLCRVMQNYCGEPKNHELLKIGKIWLADIENNVVPEAYAPNPHLLMRILESINYIYCDELIISACQAREASSQALGFMRQDYPEMDPAAWHKFITIRQEKGGTKTKKLEIGFWGNLSDNYEACNQDYQGYLSKK